MMRKLLALTVLAVALLDATAADAQIPRLITFQGRLADGDGTPITGTLTMTFSLWTATSQGTSCFSETHTGVTLTSGLFAVSIGSLTSGGIATACTFAVPYYLQIQVAGDDPMSPRLALSSAPYALVATSADGTDKLNGLTLAQLTSKTIYGDPGTCLAGTVKAGSTCTAYTYSSVTAGGCGAGAPNCPSGCTSVTTTCEWTGYQQPSFGCTGGGCDPYGYPYACSVTGPSATNLYQQKRTCSCTAGAFGYVR